MFNAAFVARFANLGKRPSNKFVFAHLFLDYAVSFVESLLYLEDVCEVPYRYAGELVFE